MNAPVWTTACPDWEQRILAGESLVPFEPLFPAEAQAALDIFSTLKIVDAPGRPTIEQACREWVFDFARAVFGSYDPATGRRLIRYFLLLVSKKNSKSTIAAGVMLTALLRNWRTSGEYYILAPTKEVADNSFFPARDMISADEELQELLHVNNSTRTITHRNTKAFLKIVAADTEVVSGKKTIGLFIDELWLFGKRANAAHIFREAMGGLASRPEGFVIYATTQSDDQPAGVFAETLTRFRAIRDGKIVDPRSLGMLYEFPQALLESEEYRDRKYRYVTNPNLGASVDDEFLDDMEEKAEFAGTAEVTGFLAKHLNVEVSVGGSSGVWGGAEFWAQERNTDRTLTLEALCARSEVVAVGVDGGGMDDLLGFTAIGREKVTQRWLTWSCAWAHKVIFKRRKIIETQLREFEREGTLTVVEDDSGDDIVQLADKIDFVRELGLLPAEHAIGVDPAGIALIVNELRRREYSVTEDAVVGQVTAVPQGYISLNNTNKTAERLLGKGELVHPGSKLMNWCVSNAKAEKHGNAVVITKAAAGSAKIDPLMAMFNAVALMLRNPEAEGVSVFDREDDAGGDEDDEDKIDEAILKDPRHPRFAEMRERWYRRRERAGAYDEDVV